MNKTSYQITGLHCGKCVRRVTEALLPYAKTVEVTLSPPRVHLTETSASFDQLNAVAASVGDYQLAIVSSEDAAPAKSWLQTYYPLLLIVSYIAIGSFAGIHSSHDWMFNFMAGFFLVFSFFKLLNLTGFATAYAGYDLLAKRSRTYALAYPFIELALGLAYLFRLYLPATLIVTAILMAFGSIGVITALRRGGTIQCACLGTTLNLPMSTVTIVEDIGMAAMAVMMLIVHD